MRQRDLRRAGPATSVGNGVPSMEESLNFFIVKQKKKRGPLSFATLV